MSLLSHYLTLNVLLLAGFILSGVLIRLSSRTKLQFSYGMIVFCLGLTAFHFLLPKNNFLIPSAKVWSAPSSQNFYQQYSEAPVAGYMTLGESSFVLKSQDVSSVALIILTFVLLAGVYFLSRDLYHLYRIQKKSFLYKKIGKVSIYLHDEIQVPFSFYFLKAYVVLPIQMLMKPADFKIAVLHELQHHRQKDTLWVYVLWFLKTLCVINPFVQIWLRQISEIQEFACDEALLLDKKVDSQAYARCLFEVAQTANLQGRGPVCATGLSHLMGRSILKRRIEKMFIKTTTTKTTVKIALGIFVASLLSMAAYASTNLVQDRRITMSRAIDLARKSQNSSSFPIVVNDLVLKELNRYLGTPEGREFMKQALVRMESYKPLVMKNIRSYRLPEELLAVPIIESGYKNLPQSENKKWGAGLWMFIEPTARNYGLRIDSTVDERLNPEVLTDAAMRYLSANYNRFRDYNLALLAYNIGEERVQRGINKLGTRDAWQLTRNGYQGDQYLARLMAAILIMRSPDVLD